jgi:hypothetical protein
MKISEFWFFIFRDFFDENGECYEDGDEDE